MSYVLNYLEEEFHLTRSVVPSCSGITSLAALLLPVSKQILGYLLEMLILGSYPLLYPPELWSGAGNLSFHMLKFENHGSV